jgi:hypothetical protein
MATPVNLSSSLATFVTLFQSAGWFSLHSDGPKWIQYRYGSKLDGKFRHDPHCQNTSLCILSTLGSHLIPQIGFVPASDMTAATRDWPKTPLHITSPTLFPPKSTTYPTEPHPLQIP